MKASAKLRPSPIQPTCHSHNLRFQKVLFEILPRALGGGTKMAVTIMIITAGAIRPMTTRTGVETRSESSYGNEMFRSINENGR